MQFLGHTIGAVFTVFLLTVPSLAQTPAGFNPATNNSLSVNFSNITVSPGSSVPLTDVSISPLITLPPANTSHLILIVDLDAPYGASNNSFSPLIHWLQPSIPANITNIRSNYSNAAVAVPYAGPAPPPGSGPHRYVVLAFAQQSPSFGVPEEFEKFNATYRFVFDVEKFVLKAGLGRPVAASWFTVENATKSIVTKGSSISSGKASISSALWVMLALVVMAAI